MIVKKLLEKWVLWLLQSSIFSVVRLITSMDTGHVFVTLELICLQLDSFLGFLGFLLHLYHYHYLYMTSHIYM